MWTKRSSGKPNVVSQEIRHLVPGKMYSVRMITGDYQEVTGGKAVSEKHAVSLSVSGAELAADRCFDCVAPRSVGTDSYEFRSNMPRVLLNYHYRLFRATGRNARLTLSDWADANSPGGPIGQELMYNSVEVQPYFEE